MTNQDMDFLARKIVSLENKHNALARARQLPNSSVRLIDGSDVSMRDSVESGSDNRAAIEQLEGATTDIGSITDTGAENAVSVPDWFNELGVGVDVAWDSTQFLTDLSLELETELGQAQQDLAQAQLDVEQAMLDVAEALQEAQTATQVAGDANIAASDAVDAAAAAQTTAGNAQIAAGNAQDAADQAAADALAAANAANTAQNAADDAQMTADAKGKVIIQTATPNAADRLPQNLWIDTTDGANTPKRWSGSAWVAVTDKAATDAAAAAVAAQSTANTAYNEAVSAATAAGNAQTAANGKNTVWYQNDQPAGSGHKTGDTWFDTNDGNRVYRWNGAWTSAQFGTNAISDTAINAAKLASNAVTEGKILNGAITNDKLASAVQSAITTAQSTATNAATVASNAATAASTAQDAADAAQSTANSAAAAASTAQTAANNAANAASAAQDDADQAIADALAAANAASGAQNTANAKGKVIIQSAAPATADRLAQNLWIDTTSSANTPKRWNGTAWVAVTDKTATDAAAAAVAAQGTANTAQTAANNAASAASIADGKAVAAQNAANAAQGTANTATTIANGAQSAASAAQTAANNAQTTANAAQTTANGKNKIVRSTADASSPGNYVAGDQWWKYSGSQITAMWIHSGSAWVSQTLTDSVITNLNAGTITAGTINAARIAANTITGTHIAGTTITAANMVTGTITAASGIIAEAAIGTANIIDSAITNAKIDNLAVTNAKIADATIQHAKIGSVDAAKITVGTLNAARIASNTISTQKLLLTSFENLAQDYSFEYNNTEAWQMVANSANETTNPRTGSRALRVTTTSSAFVAARQVARFSVAGGERYRVSAWVRLDSGVSALTGITLRFAYASTEGGSTTSASDVATTPTGTGTTYVQISGIWVVPAAAKFATLEIISRDTTAGKNYRIDDVEIYKMTSAELIVDGAITATKMAANSITATNGALENLVVTTAKLGNLAVTEGKIGNLAVTTAKIANLAVSEAKIIDLSVSTAKIANLAVTDAKIGSLSAEKITAGTINADRIGANTISATKISGGDFAGKTFTGGIFTGSTFRTAASGQRMQLDNVGLRAYDSGGGLSAELKSEGGNLSLQGALSVADFVTETGSGPGYLSGDGLFLNRGINRSLRGYFGNTSPGGAVTSLFAGAYPYHATDMQYTPADSANITIRASDQTIFMNGNVVFQGDHIVNYSIPTIPGYDPGWSPGVLARHVKHGNLCYFQAETTADRVASRISGIVTVPLPYPAIGGALNGKGWLLNVSTGVFYDVALRLASSTTLTMEILRHDSTGNIYRAPLNQHNLAAAHNTRWRVGVTYMCE